MFATKQLLALTIACTGLTATANTASAGVYEHLDGLSCTLRNQTRYLSNHLQQRYGHVQCQAMLVHTHRMTALAEHVHEVALHHGSVAHLNQDLRELDRLFHQVQRMAVQAERRHNPRFGLPCNTMDPVAMYLRAIDRNLHHMRADVQQLLAGPVRRGPVYNQRTVVPVRGGVDHHDHDHRNDRRTRRVKRGAQVSFGNGQVQLYFP